MRELNKFPSNELAILLNLLETTSPKLVTERTVKGIWINRLKEAHKDSFESEQTLNF